MRKQIFSTYLSTSAGALSLAIAAAACAAPKVIVISLDGAQPARVETYLASGALPQNAGLGLLRSKGSYAQQNVTETPSVTAVSHIAIATGSTAVHNDIPANFFHPVAATIGTGISGFGAPIGGYNISPLGPDSTPTAEPLWVRLRAAGKTVVTATWPGGDGADIRIAGTTVQSATPTRTVDYTVPFGSFGGLGAQGFVLTSASFSDATSELTGQLKAAGRTSFSTVKTASLETFYCSSSTTTNCSGTTPTGRDLTFNIRVAALDTTNDSTVNYDMLVLYDAASGVAPGPFALPATGPAYVKRGGPSGKFYFTGTGNKIGTAYIASFIAPDLSTVRLARYGANFIPRNAAVIGAVDDINHNVGFWAPQPDFRIPQRISPGFGPFPDLELEAMYVDQIRTFTAFQARVGMRAISQAQNADLVMIYFEQPDGAGHQFLVTDPRQAINPADPTSIGTPGVPVGASGQDEAKKARFESYLKLAYQQANNGVQAIIKSVGLAPNRAPRSNIIVVSDHGMAPFHTAVSLRNLLLANGITSAELGMLGLRTTGPAVNIYVNLQGRESGGTVNTTDYQTLVTKVAAALNNATDPNPRFNYSQPGGKVFTHVASRPFSCAAGVGFCLSTDIGQDSGDVFAMMAEGYNFDGTQSPGVARLGDPTFNSASTVFSVASFYGAHGHDSSLPSMSAIFYAAGPNVKTGVVLPQMRNIDIAPTVLQILGVSGAGTIDGASLTTILQ